MRSTRIFVTVAVLAAWFVDAVAAERHMMQPRVPADKLAEARALTNPLPDSPDIVERGKTLYEGKGTCFNCHGKSGQGDGPVAMGLDPAPRNFHHHGFWRHRTEGELFWVIKHGSSGTSMIGFGDQLTDEEIWSLIRYERTFADDRGSMHGMRARSGMGRMGAKDRDEPEEGASRCGGESCGR